MSADWPGDLRQWIGAASLENRLSQPVWRAASLENRQTGLGGKAMVAKYREGGRVAEVIVPTRTYAQALVHAFAGGRVRWVSIPCHVQPWISTEYKYVAQKSRNMTPVVGSGIKFES